MLLSAIGTVIGQDSTKLVKLGKAKYQYGERVEKLYRMEDIFQEDPASLHLFKGYQKVRKSQRRANLIGLGILGVSAVGAKLSTVNCENNSGDLCGLGAAVTFGAVNAANLIYVLLANTSASQKKEKFKNELFTQFNSRVFNDLPGIHPEDEISKAPSELLTYSYDSKLWNIGEQSGKFKEIAPSLVYDKSSLDLYTNYEYHRRKTKRRFLTAGIIGGAVLTMTIVNNTVVSHDTAKASGHIRLTQVYPGAAAMIAGGLGLISCKNKVNAQDDLIRYYNQMENPISMGLQQGPYIDIVFSNGGVGVAYVF